MHDVKADAAQVVAKIKPVIARGEQCSGMLCNRPAAHWTDVFNAAAMDIGFEEIITVPPLAGPKREQLIAHLEAFDAAFRRAGQRKVAILADQSGNGHQTDQRFNLGVSNMIGQLVQRHKQASFIMVVPEGRHSQDVLVFDPVPRP